MDFAPARFARPFAHSHPAAPCPRPGGCGGNAISAPRWRARARGPVAAVEIGAAVSVEAVSVEMVRG